MGQGATGEESSSLAYIFIVHSGHSWRSESGSWETGDEVGAAAQAGGDGGNGEKGAEAGTALE